MSRNRSSSSSTWVRYAKGLFLICAVSLSLFIFLIWTGFFGPVPGKNELQNTRHHEASQVLSADGELLGTYFLQNRTRVSLDEVNPQFTNALLAIEDIRFYDHNGIDYRAMVRVLLKSIFLGQDAGGGSTLSQQLAKNLYPRQHDGYLHLVADKVREMIIARRLEDIYSKQEILELYINTISFGEETFGVEMASIRFFNKQPSDLSLDEAATLAGLLKATSWYNPYRNPDRSERRRNVVLRQMEKYGMISPDEAYEAIDRPLMTDYRRTTASEGPAAYFREHLRMELQQILNNQPADDGKKYNLYTDGLVIETTLDSRIQHAAERAVDIQMKQLQELFDQEKQADPVFSENDDPGIIRGWQRSDHYKQLKNDGYSEEEIEEVLHTPVKSVVFSWDGGTEERTISPYDSLRHYYSFLNAGFLALEPQTGNVLAWVGGIDHQHFKYDHIKARRQAGSAFKPILYSAAFESGRKPCDYQRNVLSSYAAYEKWTPQNTGEEYGGRYSLQSALAKSVNTVAVDVLMETGIAQVQNTAKRMGITSYIPAEPSIALGSAGVSLLELTTAYTTFLNDGNPASPKMIKAIFNAEGELIYDFEHTDADSSQNSRVPYQVDYVNTEEEEESTAISPETAAGMVNILAKTVNEGTGQSLRTRFGIQHALAGKTGTTQNFTDGWFIGMTPDIVFGAWVGGRNSRVHFNQNMGYASQTALPLTGYFLNNLKEYPELRQADHFYPEQIATSYNMECPDYRDDKITDRIGDFFKGRNSDEARIVKDDDDKGGNIFQRIGRLFSKD